MKTFIALTLLSMSVFADTHTSIVWVPISETQSFKCLMQTNSNLMQGFVDLKSCSFCVLSPAGVVCTDKKEESS